MTEFDPNDDLPLTGLRLGPDGRGYDGPYLIVNTAKEFNIGVR